MTGNRGLFSNAYATLGTKEASKPILAVRTAQICRNSRREFLQICAVLTASIGLEASFVPKVAYALENKPRLPVIYLNLQECTCCAESFIRTAHPLLADMLFNMISLDYMETLQAAAGHQAEAAKKLSLIHI